ncbi:MAG: phosphotransferase [Deltaproteobacteria bacterium]|nr:MAG: phosphotransferase [Deltaproteobacteria bacterium]
MNTRKIQHQAKGSPGKSHELWEIAHELGLVAAESTFLRKQIVEIVEQFYRIGEVKEVYEIHGGYINRSFGLVVQTDKGLKDYFLRKYKRGIAPDEIKFEHALINHCIAKGLTVAARVIANRQGRTYVKTSNSRSIFAVYEFLNGDDKYTWDNPILNDEEYISAAKLLAIFHNAARDFDPKGLQRVEARILDLLPTFSVSLQEYAQATSTSKFDRYFLDNLKHILNVINNTRFDQTETSKMPLNPIHCDYHPGNLKFENSQVVGIFDFDWSKVDLRLFDVCLALAYFCSSWEDHHDGEIRLDKCILFLKTYQEQMKRMGVMAPLNEIEIKNLPTMLAAANLYLINWIVTTYYTDPDLNDYEYLAYLKHTVRLMHWIENHVNDITQMASTTFR